MHKKLSFSVNRHTHWFMYLPLVVHRQGDLSTTSFWAISCAPAPWYIFLFCLVMFYMQHKSRGKAAKVFNFVAKWLNLCPTIFLGQAKR